MKRQGKSESEIHRNNIGQMSIIKVQNDVVSMKLCLYYENGAAFVAAFGEVEYNKKSSTSCRSFLILELQKLETTKEIKMVKKMKTVSILMIRNNRCVPTNMSLICNYCCQ